MEQKRRQFRGGGVSLRITPRLAVSVGGGRSDAEQVFNVKSTGTLYFTNKRLIFYGIARSLTIDFAEITKLPLGPDHIQVQRENLPTEIFAFDSHWLAYERVRVLITRLWLCSTISLDNTHLKLGHESWDIPPLDSNHESADSEDAYSEEIESLHEAIDLSGTVSEVDLDTFESLVRKVRNFDGLPGTRPTYAHFLIDFSRDILIARIFDRYAKGELGVARVRDSIARIKSAQRLMSQHIVDFEVTAQQRMLAWPANHQLAGTDGPIGRLLEAQLSDPGFLGAGVGSEEPSEMERRQKASLLVFCLAFEAEAVAKSHHLTHLTDSQVLAYMAFREAGEETFGEYLDPGIAVELDRSTMFSAIFGKRSVALLDCFIRYMGELIPKEFEHYYYKTKTDIKLEIFHRARPQSSPIASYKEILRIADGLWAHTAKHAASAVHSHKANAKSVAPSLDLDLPVSYRLNRLKQLFDNNDITALEYQRQRQRILGEL